MKVTPPISIFIQLFLEDINAMFTQSVSPYPKDGIYQTNKSFKFREIPQIEPRSRPRTPTEGSLEAGPWLERDRGTSYLLVVLTTLFFILVISLSFYIGRTWESQFSSSATLLLEDITQYCQQRTINPLFNDIDFTQHHCSKTSPSHTPSHNSTALS